MTDAIVTPTTLDQRIKARGDELLQQQQEALWKQTDRLMACLLLAQWLACIAIAMWLSPLAWEGLSASVHPHIWAAVFLGGVIAALPIGLAIFRPGETLTRMVISASQTLHSALLIHLSGGRIETHFHIFGSLAFLSFYRDWRVLVPATVVVALDHAVRGLYFPESVFGVLAASPWRWLEHAGWVVFEDVFLAWGCVRGARELAMLAMRQAELEATNERVEAEVVRKTAKLEEVTQELVTTARRAGMAEIATGVLHNVGNVLNSVNVSASVAVRKLKDSKVNNFVKAGQMIQANRTNLADFLVNQERGRILPGFLIDLGQCVCKEQAEVLGELERLSGGLEHIKQIVGDQQQHAKQSVLRENVVPAELIEQAISMDPQLAGNASLRIVRDIEPIEAIALDKHRVLQILINLLSNAAKAVNPAPLAEKSVVVSVRRANNGKSIQFQVSDNGVGIEPQDLARIFAHGFTTSQTGHGFGLHSSANAAREMGGNLVATSAGRGQGATFVLDLPLTGLSSAEEMLIRKKRVPTCSQP
jgi:signal transduction histidine kinase